MKSWKTVIVWCVILAKRILSSFRHIIKIIPCLNRDSNWLVLEKIPDFEYLFPTLEKPNGFLLVIFINLYYWEWTSCPKHRVWVTFFLFSITHYHKVCEIFHQKPSGLPVGGCYKWLEVMLSPVEGYWFISVKNFRTTFDTHGWYNFKKDV